MAKGSSGFDSGGNGYSVSSIKKQLQELVVYGQAPKLEGSEKQIEWAKQIRSDFARNLLYAISSGLPDYVKARNSGGEEAVAKLIHDEAVNRNKGRYDYISNKKLAKSEENKSIMEDVGRRVKAYNMMAKRAQALNEILKNKSAKFWIDNRNSYNEIKKKIMGPEYY